MGSLNCNELKMKKYTLLLIWVYLALASCGSPKNLGPSFGGGDEMPELVSKVESKERTIDEASEGSSIVIETKGDVKSSNTIEVIDRPIHRINYQKNVLVQPVHHRQSLLLDSQATDSNLLALKKWNRVTNWGKWIFSVGALGVSSGIGFILSLLGIFLAVSALGLFLMVYGSKERHKYKPIAESQNTGPIPNTNTVSVPPISESQNTGPTPNSNAVSESPELRELRQKKDLFGLLILVPFFAIGLVIIAELGASTGVFGVMIVLISLVLILLFLIASMDASIKLKRKKKALLEEAN